MLLSEAREVENTGPDAKVLVLNGKVLVLDVKVLVLDGKVLVKGCENTAGSPDVAVLVWMCYKFSLEL